MTVAAQNTRVNDSETNTNWSNEGGGGPSPAAEPQLAYQGSNAVNRKTTSTGGRTGLQYNHGSTVDMTAPANSLWLAKVYVADFGDLNAAFGVELLIGSASSARYGYCVAGTNANRAVFSTYPAQGGYLIVALNPNISAWRESTTGSPSLAAVDHFAVAAQFVAGGAKSENLALDAVDVGTGLLYTDGTVGTPITFADGVTADQNTGANRWGYANASGDAIFLRGVHELSDGATAVVFIDSSVVFFPDGYHGPGDSGIKVDLTQAGTDVQLLGTYTGLGSSATSDTRPDHVVTGSSGSYLVAGTLANHRNIAFSAGCTVDGAAIECSDLAQGGATIQNSTVRCNSASGIAMCDDADFSLLSNINIVQSGSGHAFEITSPGVYAFTSLFFEGFGANGTASSAIHNNSGGSVTLNISDGDTPTYLNGASATTSIVQANQLTLTGLIVGTEVRVFDAGTTTEITGDESVASATYSAAIDAASYPSIDISIISIGYQNIRLLGVSMSSGGVSIPVQQRTDRQYANP